MSDRKRALEDFIKNTRAHQMTVELDQGVHRSVYFGRPGSSPYHFRLNTWPGHLSISGDMGTYVFSRTEDMFGFFREKHGILSINPQYWHEKMQAQDKNSSAKVFSRDRFLERVKDHTDTFEIQLGEANKLRQEIKDHFDHSDVHDETSAYEAITDFRSSWGHEIEDWEGGCLDYGYNFLWVLYAIVWGIKKYDQLKDGNTQADHDRRVLAGEI